MPSLNDVMESLRSMGSEQTKKTLMNHGAPEPLFGVKIGDMKKLVRTVRKDRRLVAELYETGNSDAMYLAGLAVDPKSATKDMLRSWAGKASWHMLAETTVAGVAAESAHALELAREWMSSDEELVAACGWSTYAHHISMTPDEELDLAEIRRLLGRIEETVHRERNRVRYVMNGFVIAVGVYVRKLHEEAMSTAGSIGKVSVNVGQTACKVPLAGEYIGKAAAAGKLGTKKKTCIC